MKLYRTENKIISLENVRQVELSETTSQHTRNKEKYTDYHYTIFISYMVDGQYARLELPDNDKTNAKNVFEKIFEIISE